MERWAARRLAELHAAAPQRKKKIQPYVKVSLERAARAAAALGDRRLFVWIWILHRTWQRGTSTVVVPSAALRKFEIRKRPGSSRSHGAPTGTRS